MTAVPTGKCSTNDRNASRSLTDFGGVTGWRGSLFAAPRRLLVREVAGGPVDGSGERPSTSADAAGSTSALVPRPRREPASVAPGGGNFGTGIGPSAEIAGGVSDEAAERTPLRPEDRPGALSTTFCSFTDRRLIGPLTGTRFTKTQPTWGTGLPPIKRPSSNSHAYSP